MLYTFRAWEHLLNIIHQRSNTCIASRRLDLHSLINTMCFLGTPVHCSHSQSYVFLCSTVRVNENRIWTKYLCLQSIRYCQRHNGLSKQMGNWCYTAVQLESCMTLPPLVLPTASLVISTSKVLRIWPRSLLPIIPSLDVDLVTVLCLALPAEKVEVKTPDGAFGSPWMYGGGLYGISGWTWVLRGHVKRGRNTGIEPQIMPTQSSNLEKSSQYADVEVLGKNVRGP